MNESEKRKRSLVNFIHQTDPMTFESRAVEFLGSNPKITASLILLRKMGKVDLPEDTVLRLCQYGIFTADENGFFVSEIAEDMIDSILIRLGHDPEEWGQKKISPEGPGKALGRPWEGGQP